MLAGNCFRSTFKAIRDNLLEMLTVMWTFLGFEFDFDCKLFELVNQIYCKTKLDYSHEFEYNSVVNFIYLVTLKYNYNELNLIK